jgi:CheY-like chemotaxis protein
MRVLVVEDEEVLSEVFRDFLTELGHQPVVVRSAEAALGTLETERPDAIILDIHLPGMSGLDFMQLRPIRESGLPIVAVSGIVTESQARECLRLGALDFVGKPVPLARLQDVLTYLEPHALHRRHDVAQRQPDRRHAPRIAVDLPVMVREYRGAVWPAACVELSATGMKVRTDAALTVGAAVKASLALADGGEPVEVISLVLRSDSTGTVLSFVNLPAHEHRRLSELVRRRSR